MSADSYSDLGLLVRFEDEVLAGLSPMTARNVTGAVLRFGRWLEPRPMLDATTGDVAAWIDSGSPAPSTRSARLSALHRFYNWALNAGHIDRDPAAPLVRIKQRLNAGDFPDLEKRWLVAQERRGLKASTIQVRAYELRMMNDWLAPKSIADATTEDIERWLDSRRLAPKSRYRTLSNLHSFYKWAKREGLVEGDPTEVIDRPRCPVGVPRPISDADLALALEKADPVMRMMLCLAAFAGLRAQEIAGVRRDDVLDQVQPPVVIVTNPKGHRQRVVPLHPAILEALRVGGLPRHGHLFCWPDGRPFPAWKVSQEVNGYLHGLGIEATCHQLRHAFGTKVYGGSLDLRLTQELLGHSSPTTTAIYVQYNRAGAHDVVSRIAVQA